MTVARKVHRATAPLPHWQQVIDAGGSLPTCVVCHCMTSTLMIDQVTQVCYECFIASTIIRPPKHAKDGAPTSRAKDRTPAELAAEDRLLFNACVLSLTPRQRWAFLGIFVEGRRQADVAGEMNCSQPRIATLVREIRRVFRNLGHVKLIPADRSAGKKTPL